MSFSTSVGSRLPYALLGGAVGMYFGNQFVKLSIQRKHMSEIESSVNELSKNLKEMNATINRIVKIHEEIREARNQKKY